MFAPLDVASFLKAPYGWTDRLRREEGYPARGERSQRHLGARWEAAVAVATYCPVIVGALLGWRAWGGWTGAGIGAVAGLAAQAVVLMAALPVLLFLWSKKTPR